MANSPLYFVRSGWIGINIGALMSIGDFSYIWSSMAAIYSSVASARAYNLGFNAISTYPSGGPNNRWSDFPLRCLGSGGDNYSNEHLGQVKGQLHQH